MLSTPESSNSFLQIKTLLLQPRHTIRLKLNNERAWLKSLFISATLYLDSPLLSDKTLALNIPPKDSIDDDLKFRMYLLYLESISQMMLKNQISQAMYHAAIKSIIETFQSFTEIFNSQNNVWEALFKTAPESLSLYENNPLLQPFDLVKKQIQPIFLNRRNQIPPLSQDLLLSMNMAYKRYGHIFFIIYLLTTRNQQIKFLNNLIYSLFMIRPSPLNNKETSDLITYFIQDLDAKFPAKESLKHSALLLIINKSFLLTSDAKNPFVVFIKKNHNLAIEIIKKDSTIFENAHVASNLSKQFNIPITDLFNIERIRSKINIILHEAMFNHGNLSQLPLSCKETNMYISELIASLFNHINVLPINLTQTLPRTLSLAQTYLFKETDIAIHFIKHITPSYRYHFSLDLICHLLSKNIPITSDFLESISENIPPISEQSISNTPFSSFRFTLIMNKIIDSKLTSYHNISENHLPLLYWMIKYFHNIIHPDFFSNSHEIFIDIFLQDMKSNPQLYSELSLTEQIDSFKQNCLLTSNGSLPAALSCREVGTDQNTGEPSKKRVCPPPFETMLSKESELFFKQTLTGNLPLPPQQPSTAPIPSLSEEEPFTVYLNFQRKKACASHTDLVENPSHEQSDQHHPPEIIPLPSPL